jgi:hypothetical protein
LELSASLIATIGRKRLGVYVSRHAPPIRRFYLNISGYEMIDIPALPELVHELVETCAEDGLDLSRLVAGDRINDAERVLHWYFPENMRSSAPRRPYTLGMWLLEHPLPLPLKVAAE